MIIKESEEAMANQLDNTESMYQNLYDIMMHHFHEENHAQSDKMAQDLLLNADLPVRD